MYQVEQMTTGVTYTGLETVHGQSVMVKVVACRFVSQDSLVVVVPRIEQARRNPQAWARSFLRVHYGAVCLLLPQ